MKNKEIEKTVNAQKESPRPAGGKKNEIPSPAVQAAVKKNKVREVAEEQAKNGAPISAPTRKTPAKRGFSARKRGRGESYTESIPHSGEVTVYSTDIAIAGAWLKSVYLPILKDWEVRLKSGAPVQGGKTGLKTPSWPAFKNMLEFAAPALAPKMHSPAMGKHKPSHGKTKGRKPQAKLAIVVWQRENKEFFRKEISPRHERINAMLKSIVTRSVSAESMDDGKVRGRIFRKSVCLSAPKA